MSRAVAQGSSRRAISPAPGKQTAAADLDDLHIVSFG